MSTEVAIERERLDAVEAMIGNINRLSMLIPLEDARAFVNALNRQETLMPILDPTSWIHSSDRLGVAGSVAAAFLQFRAELEKIVPDAERAVTRERGVAP